MYVFGVENINISALFFYYYFATTFFLGMREKNKNERHK